MANLQKFTRGGVIGLSNHIERKTENHSNKEIDVSRSHLNYSLVKTGGDMSSRLKKRLDEVYCFKRADVNVLGSWIVTLPKNLKDNSEEEQRQFFEQSFNFMARRYGEKNVIAGEVHLDETTPHIHFSFVPVVPDVKKGEKVSAKLLLNRTDLKSFHTDLDRHLKNTLAFYEGGVLTGDTDKTIKDAKEFKKVMQATDVQKNELRQTIKQKKVVQNQKDAVEFDLKKIKNEFDQRAAANETLKLEMSILTKSYNQKMNDKEKLDTEVADIKDKFSDAQLNFDVLNQQLLELKTKKELMDKELEEYKNQLEETKKVELDKYKKSLEKSKKSQFDKFKTEYLTDKNEYINDLGKKVRDENATLKELTKEIRVKQTEFKEIDNYLKTSLKPFTEEFLGKDKVNDYQTNMNAIDERVRPVKAVFGLKSSDEVKMSIDDYEKLVEYAGSAVKFRDNYYLQKNENEKLISDNKRSSSQSSYNFDRYKVEKAEHDELKETHIKLKSNHAQAKRRVTEMGNFLIKNNLIDDFNKFRNDEAIDDKQLSKKINKVVKIKERKEDPGLEL